MLLFYLQFCYRLFTEVFDLDRVGKLFESLISVGQTLVKLLDEVSGAHQNKPDLLTLFYFERVKTISLTLAELVPE